MAEMGETQEQFPAACRPANALTDMDVGNARVVGSIHGPCNAAISNIAKRCPAIASAYAMAFDGAKQALPKDTTSPMLVKAFFILKNPSKVLGHPRRGINSGRTERF
jgi:hypothetical protein